MAPVSRNFEILRKANRTEELFGPDPANGRRAMREPLVSLSGPCDARESYLTEIATAAPKNGVSNMPALRPEFAAGSEDWRQLVKGLLAFQNSNSHSSVGICAAKQGESAAPFIAMLGEYLNGCVDSPVLLVEATFQTSSLAQILGVPAAPGLDEILRDPVDPVQVRSDCFHQSRFGNVWVLPAGRVANWRNLAELGRDFRGLYDWLTARFRIVVVALPPADGASDLLFPYSAPDSVVLLVKPNSTGVRDLERAMRRLADAEANVVGTILNDLEPPSASHTNGSWWGRIGSILKMQKAS